MDTRRAPQAGANDESEDLTVCKLEAMADFLGSFTVLLLMEEILHQLIGGKHPIIGFQPSKVVQDFATINSSTPSN